MNTRRTTHTLSTLTVAAALTAALTGCNTSANADPNQTIGRCTECTAAPTPAATSTTLDPAAKEQADRTEATAIWRQYIQLIFAIDAMPSDKVDAAVKAVAVDPTASLLLKKPADDRAKGLGSYGVPISFVSWPKPINGADTAVLSDCQDGSQAGVLNTKDGTKVGVGTVNTPIRGFLTRTPNGWRVSSSELIKGGTCTPEG